MSGAPAEHVLRVEGVSKAFHREPVLRDVDLRVRAGELVALVGPSGAGKSTLLRLVTGIHRADAGRVLTLGTDPARCGRRELQALRAQVGFVFQDFGLVGRLCALENVLMGALHSLRLPRYGLLTYPVSLRERAVEQLERVGLVDQRFQRTDTLSGGQQQRVAVARTLLQGPRLLLADEPVASLDPSAGRAVLDTLRRLCAEDGIGVVCSLHQLDLALAGSDRVVALREGRVVLDQATGSLAPEQLHAVFTTGAARA